LKFQDILDEAQKGDSIFKAGNIIKIEEIEENISTTQLALNYDTFLVQDEAYSYGIAKTEKNDEIIDKAFSIAKEEIQKEIISTRNVELSREQKIKITEKVVDKIKENKNIREDFVQNELPLYKWINNTVDKTTEKIKEKCIPIPRLIITDEGTDEYGFVDFDLDLSEFNYVPIKNELLIQNLKDLSDSDRIDGDTINFEGYNPKKEILEIIRTKPEIDYEKCSCLLFKLISQLVEHYENKYDTKMMQNIIMMNKKDIASKIYSQMMQDNHFYCENSLIQYSVMDVKTSNIFQTYRWDKMLNLYENYDGNIKSILFDGISKGIFDTAKFDSYPELLLTRILEKDDVVKNWLRPAQKEFNITYNRGRYYVPDFVVETDDCFFIVEVKGEDKINDADVIAKSKKAIIFCEVASNWSKENGRKEWKYLFIPSKEIMPSSSFKNLVDRFIQE